MRKTRLTPQDFELETLEDNGYQYFVYDDADFQICIEPCDRGYDVALYDHNGIIVGRRKSLNSSDYMKPLDCYMAAVDLASEMMLAHNLGNGALAY